MSKIYKNINNKRKPAKVFHPGIYIGDELKARGWSIEKFNDMTNLSTDNIKSLLHGDEDITPEIAKILSKALGTSAELWLILQNTWDERNNR